jgi:hypothetical protein
VGLAIVMISHASLFKRSSSICMKYLPLHPTAQSSHIQLISTILQPAITKQMLGNLGIMEQRRPPEYIIEVFADPSSVKDVVRGTVPPTLRRKGESRADMVVG